jgi:hypothetical protein
MALVDQDLLYFVGKEYENHTIFEGSACHSKGDAVWKDEHKEWIVSGNVPGCVLCAWFFQYVHCFHVLCALYRWLASLGRELRSSQA